jgi:hypothetical protein
MGDVDRGKPGVVALALVLCALRVAALRVVLW